MFHDKGYKVTETGHNSPSFDYHPDLLCFTGGEDVDPSLYGEGKHSKTCSNLKRDLYEQKFYNLFPFVKKVGICRGGQFLAVMNGDKLYQHIDSHTNTIHNVTDYFSDNTIEVNSDHHQSIRINPSSKYEVLANKGSVLEAVYYRSTESLCFQPHPEWNHHATHELFFLYVRHYLGL